VHGQRCGRLLGRSSWHCETPRTGRQNQLLANRRLGSDHRALAVPICLAVWLSACFAGKFRGRLFSSPVRRSVRPLRFPDRRHDVSVRFHPGLLADMSLARESAHLRPFPISGFPIHVVLQSRWGLESLCIKQCGRRRRFHTIIFVWEASPSLQDCELTIQYEADSDMRRGAESLKKHEEARRHSRGGLAILACRPPILAAIRWRFWLLRFRLLRFW
jgi:hypothetical protein